MAVPSSVSSHNSSKAHRLLVVLGLAITALGATWVVTQLNGSGTTMTGASLGGSAIELPANWTLSGIEDETVADGLDQPGSTIIEPFDLLAVDSPAGSGAAASFQSASGLTNGEDPVAGLVSWADVDAGSKRLPTVTIDDSIYPQVGDNGDRTGVQFFINGDADDRNSKARPDGWDATGPQEGSTFHVYPKISLRVGDVIQARWVTPGGDTHVSELVVGGGEPVASQPTPTPEPVLVVEDVPSGTAGEDPVAGLVSWADVDAGSRRLPTVTIDDSIYPQVGDNGDRTGVQFFINGDADDRNSRARPDGWDATGPQEGSTFHVYPKISLRVGDVIQARWVTPGGDTHVSELVVGGGEPVASQPIPAPEPVLAAELPPPAPDAGFGAGVW